MLSFLAGTKVAGELLLYYYHHRLVCLEIYEQNILARFSLNMIVAGL